MYSTSPEAPPGERRTPEEQLARLSALMRLNRELSESLDLDEVLNDIVRSLVELTGSDAARLFLFDERRQLLRLRAMFGGDLAAPLTETYRPGESAAGQVFATGQSIFENDYTRGKPFGSLVRAAREEEVGSFIVHPLRSEQRIIGTLSCVSRRRYAYVEEDLDILEAFAAQAAIAIHNAESYRESEERAKRLAALVRVTQQLTQGLDVNELLGGIVRSVVELTGGDLSRLFLHDPKAGLLRVRAAYYGPGIPPHPVEAYRPGESYAGQVFSTGRPAIINELPDFDMMPRKDWVLEQGLRSFIVLPLRAGGKVIGVLNCVSREPRHFTEADIEFVQSFAEHAAIALRNADLYQRAEERTTRLAQLNELNSKIAAKLDLSEVLHSITTAATQGCGADISRIFLLDPDDPEKLILKISQGPEHPASSGVVSLPLRDSIGGEVARTGKPALIDDVQEQPLWRNHEWARKSNMRSFMAHPLRVGSRIIGLITCMSARPAFFQEEDSHILEALASQAALAIQNAELYTEAMRSRNFFQSILEENADAIIVVEPGAGTITHWNKAAEALYQYTAEEMIGRPVDLLHQEGDETVLLRKRVLESGKPLTEECLRVRKDGKEVPVSICATPIYDEKNRAFALVSIHRDRTKQKEIEDYLKRTSERYEKLSRTDDLTGLFNRRVLMENLVGETIRARRYDSPLCFLMLDIDHFKQVNDTHGHLTGDEVLKGIANAIREVSRQTDIASRYGGEEFCIVLPETEIQGAYQFAHRLHRRVAEIHFDCPQGGTFSVTCSIGLSSFRSDSDSGANLIDRADQALYQAKQTGRNRICTTV